MGEFSKKALFVTGGSGFLGAHFIWHVLTKTDYHIVANMRSSADCDGQGDTNNKEVAVAKARLLQILAKTAHAYGLAEDRIATMKTLLQAPERITLVLNNLSEKKMTLNLGVLNTNKEGEEARALQSLDIEACWHFAGYLTPQKKLTEYDDFDNVTMTQNALVLARRLKAKQFFHVSTAYVSGQCDGLIKEALFDFTIDEPTFRNSYERSKYFAEKMVCTHCDDYDMPLTILRPSIVIGVRSTKDNGGSQSGFYGVLKAFWRLGGRALKENIKIPVALDAGLDLIPIDDFIEECWSIQEEQAAFIGEARKETQVYHLVAGKTVDPDKIIMMAAAQYNSPVEPLMIENIDGADISAKVLATQLDFYSDYVGSALRFERKRQAPPHLDDRDVLNYITSIARVYEYGSIDEVFDISLVQGHNGISLPVFDTGVIDEKQQDSKTIVFCHAMAMGAELLIPLAYHLKKAGHRLITWEARILPSLTPDFECDGSDLEVHAKDGLALIRHFGLSKAAFQVAGWSTGAGVACKLADKLLKMDAFSSFEQLLLLNGSFMLKGTSLTAFQKNMNMVMPRVSQNREVTAQLFDIVFAPSHNLKWWDVSRKVFRHQANKMMGANDPRLEHITRQPVRNSETAYRYANQIAGYMSCDWWGWLEGITVPTWVMTCEDDSMTDPSGSYAVHDLIKNSLLKVYEEGDHFKLYQAPEFFDDFLEAVTRKL